MAAIVIAAMMPAVLTAVSSITPASLLPGFASYLSSGSNPVIAVALPAQLFLTFLIATVLPSAISFCAFIASQGRVILGN